MSRSIEYHLHELEIQQRPVDDRHVRPVVASSARRVLDVGCGIGQTLITAGLPVDAFSCGVDTDEEALAFGARQGTGIQFVRASGERLPFADRSFDLVIARVSLPWMHIPTALRESFRVLEHGGSLWISLVGVSDVVSSLAAAIKSINLRNIVYRSYVVMNGVMLHVTGRQIRFPLQRRRCESFQTTHGITRLLRATGFDGIRVERNKLFIVTATKP